LPGAVKLDFHAVGKTHVVLGALQHMLLGLDDADLGLGEILGQHGAGTFGQRGAVGAVCIGTGGESPGQHNHHSQQNLFHNVLFLKLRSH